MRLLLNKVSSVFLKDINIKQKLILSYLVLIVIPLGILALLTYNRSSVILSNKMIDISSQSLEQLSITLNHTFQNVVRASNIVFSNKPIQDILLKVPENYDIKAQYDDFNFMGDYFTGIQNDQNIYRIRLYLKNETIYSNERINFFNINSIQSTDLYKLAKERNGQIFVTSPYNFKYGGVDDNQKIVSAVRVMKNTNAFGDFIGLISVDILVKDIEQIITDSTLAKSSLVFLVNEQNQIITSSDKAIMPEKYKDIINAAIQRKNESVWEKASLNREQVLTASSTVPYTGWKLCAIMPLSNILKPNIELRNYTFLLMLIIGVVAYLVALFISSSIVKRLRRLMKIMREAEKGDLSVKVDISGKDEIGELEEKFNNMLIRIEDLVEEKFKIGKESKNAELRALQAQINPHFLYNTLELITCKALKYKAKDITSLVNLLARFYKLSLSNGKDIIPIADELAHIETYINIQNKRFDEAIKLEIDIDNRILEYTILKLILQPIVENSILHGIMEKESQTGIIKIKGYFDSSDIMLLVEDDGVGMDQLKLAGILKDEQRNDGHGFGIKNVNKRLKINYGEEYGLTVRSAVNSGTTVEVRIPAVKSGQ